MGLFGSKYGTGIRVFKEQVFDESIVDGQFCTLFATRKFTDALNFAVEHGMLNDKENNHELIAFLCRFERIEKPLGEFICHRNRLVKTNKNKFL